jgi:hypothetical protein
VIEGIKSRFIAACDEALRLGAEVIIPGDGVLNAFLVRHKMLYHDGAVIMDSLGVLFHHAAFMARARASGCLDVSRRLLYAKPTDAMLDHAVTTSRLRLRDEAEFSGVVAQV